MTRHVCFVAIVAAALPGCARDPGSRVVAATSPVAPAPAPDPAPDPAPAPAPATPPAPLACIVRHYDATAQRANAAWFLVLPDGMQIPYSHQRIPTGNGYYWPNVTDLYEQRYPTGSIQPPAVDFEPGAMRLDPLLDATYGSTAEEVRAALVNVRVGGKLFMVHRRIAEPLRRVATRIAALLGQDPQLIAFFQSPGGTFNWRSIAGTHFRSSHSWGIAIDLDTKRADYWRYQTASADGPFKWKNRYPQAIVDAFEAEGFIWGGRWYHFDTMHFEYRPELLDPGCYPG